MLQILLPHAQQPMIPRLQTVPLKRSKMHRQAPHGLERRGLTHCLAVSDGSRLNGPFGIAARFRPRCHFPKAVDTTAGHAERHEIGLGMIGHDGVHVTTGGQFHRLCHVLAKPRGRLLPLRPSCLKTVGHMRAGEPQIVVER